MASIGQPRRVQQPPPPLGFFERWQRRIRNHIRQALARGDLVTMLMTIIMLSMPALAMESAGLADGILILLPIVLVGAALGYFLSWSSLSEGSALFISTVYGLSLILLLSILFLGEGGSLPARTTDLIDRVNEWTIAVDTDTPSDDNIVLVLIMAVLFWFLGHNTVWHLFRIDRVWRAILPPGLILLINNADYTGDAPLQIYLIIYVLIALLLVVRSHADAREYDWYRNRVRYPRQMRRYFLRIGAAMSLVFVLFAWLLPTLQPDGIDDFSQALSDLNEALEQLFGSDDGESVTTAEFYGGDQLELSGAIQLSDQPVFEVTVAENIGYRFYWRSTAFDTYVGGTWEHYRSVRASKEEGDLTLNIGTFLPGARQSVSQEFQMLLSASSLVYAAPQPTLFELPMRVELDCIDDLSSFECVNNNAPVDVSITRPFNLLREGDRYNVTSLVSVADADALRTASTEYPAWVTNRYLQGTEQVTPRLLELTQGIVANANNPYDRAKAIERWLRMNLAYDELIPQPPEGQDPVDWFVFDIQRGYCNYYASAMILMLRSQGIPARMAAGFSQGEFDPANNQYLVRERDAHTWVEVYFPGYGWVEFEPTAEEQEEIDRPGDSPPPPPPPQENAAQSTPTPTPTNTPSPTPTNTPTPTPQQEQPAELPQAVNPTPTPTVTPSPTATITPSPTPVAPQQETQIPPADDGPDWLRILLGIIIAVTLLTVLLVVGVVFLIWWVEHRGLGGLSLTEKAYARLGIYGQWLGAQLPPEHTPEERRQRLVTTVPEGETPISDITALYVERHFAPPRDEDDEAQAGQAWAQARIAFIRRKFKRWFGR